MDVGYSGAGHAGSGGLPVQCGISAGGGGGVGVRAICPGGGGAATLRDQGFGYDRHLAQAPGRSGGFAGQGWCVWKSPMKGSKSGIAKAGSPVAKGTLARPRPRTSCMRSFSSGPASCWDRRWRRLKSCWGVIHRIVGERPRAESLNVQVLCKAAGMSRQNYYHQRHQRQKAALDEALVVALVQAERKRQPFLGGRKLWHIPGRSLHRRGSTLGRDRFFQVLKGHNLLIIRRKRGCRTTDSRHRFKVYANLAKRWC